ncbi:MAG: hypothetical protein P4L93_04205 [Coriobacteriia bacterium]|nr:hypothetical protein [Coriobacteriia bacterium]
MTIAGRGRRVALALVALSCAMGLVAACSLRPQSTGSTPARPTASATPTVSPKPSRSAAGKPAPEILGAIKVAWVVRSGSARQDPMGVLGSTPLFRKGRSLRASRTVTFTPQVAGATSTAAKYVYTLELSRSATDPLAYKGKMRIDWTMTITRAGGKNEFQSLYDADATARYEAAGQKLTEGVAKGVSTTTDTSWVGATKSKPNRRVDPFQWSFSSQ